MNQPMQAVLVELAECAVMGEFKKDTVRQRVEKIQHHLNALRDMSRKLMHITRYETRDYLEGEKIIDIDKASGSGD
jgi:predicted transcriptional regulator